jgi:four helix bundle protein
MIGDYKKLQVWEKSIDFVKDIYIITNSFPKNEIYGLISQIRRAAVSIPANISEGRLRNGENEFKHFLYISFGSGGELETHLEIARRLGYLEEVRYKELDQKLSEIMKMLNSLIRKLEASS